MPTRWKCYQSAQNTKLSNEDLSFTIGLETAQPSDVARDLGVWLDSELSLRHHVTKIAASCFYQLRRLRQVRRRAEREVTTRLVLALVISKLDYCNSLLAGLPTSTLNVLPVSYTHLTLPTILRV